MLHGHKSLRETSADHIGPHAMLAYPSDAAEAVLARIRKLQGTTWDLVCVIDRDERLLGTLTAAELLALPCTASSARWCDAIMSTSCPAPTRKGWRRSPRIMALPRCRWSTRQAARSWWSARRS